MNSTKVIEQIQSHLLHGGLSKYKDQIQSIEPHIDSQTLGEVINDVLKPYCTQRAGGFKVHHIVESDEDKRAIDR